MKGIKINYEEMNEDEVIFLLKPIIFKGLEFARNKEHALEINKAWIKAEVILKLNKLRRKEKKHLIPEGNAND